MYPSPLSAAIVSSLAIGALSSSAPLVAIGAGTLQGGQCNGSSNAVYFKSIPFAQPPTGNLRFAPPKAYNQTYPGGSLQATSPPPACIQFGELFAETGATSEDCLYLDIWAPANATATSTLPVKVWIYGGGESDGGLSNSLYDGCNVAKDDALLVSINYRLGPLGFLALASAGIGGNQGIQDLLLGLEWVQKNIAAFGGDPKKVLLHGQSAGATNTFVIATLPDAPRLINAAITESGGGRDVPLNATAQKLGESYVQSLNCSLTDVACLLSKSPTDLITAYKTLPLLNAGLGIDGAIGIGNINTYQFAPYLDGKIIPTQPSTEGVRVPTVFGSNSEEGTLFALGQFAVPPSSVASASAQDYETFLSDNFGPAASLTESYYPLSIFNTTPYPPFFAIKKVLTDATYFCSAYRGLNRAVEKGIPVWTYLFSHDPACIWLPGLPQSAVTILGATHTAEIPFVFGNTVGANSSCKFTQQELDISATMVSAWTAMAANQNPSTGSLPWPAYTNSSSSLGLNIVNTSIPGHVNYSACVLWDAINEKLVNLSNGTASNSTSGGNATTTSPSPSASTASTPGGAASASPSGSGRPSAASLVVINTASWFALVASVVIFSLI